MNNFSSSIEAFLYWKGNTSKAVLIRNFESHQKSIFIFRCWD